MANIRYVIATLCSSGIQSAYLSGAFLVASEYVSGLTKFMTYRNMSLTVGPVSYRAVLKCQRFREHTRYQGKYAANYENTMKH
jgi:hypothetical protein